jgi:hypothetical protein
MTGATGARFEVLDEVAVPDLWDEAVRRAGTGLRAPEAQRRTLHRRPRRLPLAAAAAVLLAVVAVVVTSGDEDDGPVASGPDPGPAPERPLCVEGSVVPGSVPASARWQVSTPGTVTWRAGRDDELRLTLTMPALLRMPTADLSTEELPGDRRLWTGPDRSWLFGPTGLGRSCTDYELSATGGTGAEREAAVLGAADRLRFDPDLGLVDCGELSDHVVRVVDGDNAAAVLSAVSRLSLSLAPAGGSVTTWSMLGDGRCRLHVTVGNGEVPVEVVVSGRAGRYGVDSAIGLAPSDGVPDDAPDRGLPLASATVEQDGTEVRLTGTYWCGGCAEVELHATYDPEQVGESSRATAPVSLAVELPAPPEQGAPVVVSAVWRDADGRIRNLFAIVLPGTADG